MDKDLLNNLVVDLFHGISYEEEKAVITEEFKDIYRVQRAIYIILSKAICIEFNNSKKSAKNKMMELLDFINTQLGFVAERELNVCYYYFLHH